MHLALSDPAVAEQGFRGALAKARADGSGRKPFIPVAAMGAEVPL